MNGRPWTQEEVDLLDELLDAGRDDAWIARRLGRSPNAIKIRRQRMGLPSRRGRGSTARAVGALLGLACSKRVTWWIEQGWLRAYRGQRIGRSRREWVIQEDALLEFLQNPAHWHLWDVEAITDAGLREWAREMRGEARYLTTGEVARRYFVSTNAVQSWISRGLLPAVRRANWLVPEQALADFVPPYNRSKRGMRRRAWTDAEIRELVSLRTSGMSFPAIGRAMGRATGSVANRWYRIEPHLEAAA